MDEMISLPPHGRVIMHLGPVQAASLLGMIMILGVSIFRIFGFLGNTLLVALPLLLGAGAAIFSASELIPVIGIDTIGGCNIGLTKDEIVLHALAEIRLLLILGFLFSSLTFLAILLRNRRKSPKNTTAP